MKRAVRSRRKVYGQLLEHARRQPHRECCGILAGQDGLITQAFPAKNVAADPVRNYEIAPKEIVRVMGELRKRRLEFLGIYHSHPNWLDTNEPSPKDIALAHYSKAIYFIVTPRPYATTPKLGGATTSGMDVASSHGEDRMQRRFDGFSKERSLMQGEMLARTSP
jgi:proteasome lid subunit RPN8/RPN11